MSEQGALFQARQHDGGPTRYEPTPEASARPVRPVSAAFGGGWEERFQLFHEENPKVYDQLVRLARQLRARGLHHYSMKGLFEVLRWHRALKTQGEPFKLNNNYTAYYARVIMEREADLAGFFDTRELRA